MPRRARFLVLRGGAIGDFVFSLPVLEALRERWPDAHIEIVGYPHIANLALAADLVDHVESLDRADMARFFAPGAEFPDDQILHIRSFDIVFSYLHDPGGVVQDNLLRCGARQVVYGSPIVVRGHACDHLVKPLEALALYAAGRAPTLRLRAAILDRAREAMTARGVAPNAVAIHPGSGGEKKRWPIDRFLALAQTLRERAFPLVFLAGEADRALVPEIRRRFPDVPLAGDLTLVDIAAWLDGCRAYIGNDSGITHLAAATGIPTLALFGATDPALWAPRNANARVLTSPTPDMADLSLERVFDAFDALLAP